MELNSREIAALVWIGVLLAFMMSRRDLRSALGICLKAFLNPKVLASFLALAGYVAGLTAAASLVGLWSSDVLEETVIWFLGTGFVLLVNIGDVSKDEHFVRHKALSALKLTVALEFFVNLYVFSLPVELVLLPFLVFLAGMSAVAGSRAELAPAKTLVDGLLAIIGVTIVVYVCVRLVVAPGQLDLTNNLQALALPVWMTAGVVPFIYLVAVWSNYEVAFGRLNDATMTRTARSVAKLTLVGSLRLRGRDVQAFDGYWARELAGATSRAEARSVIAEFRAMRAGKERAERDERDRLRRYADVDCADAEGRRLDQREFNETRAALQWIATAQIGWHANGGRYRADLLDLLTPFRGLPEPHGISLQVAEDGQAWWAWRRTITGWCLAIGAAGAPPDEWLADGAEPPNDFPGRDAAWGERWGLDAKNWM